MLGIFLLANGKRFPWVIVSNFLLKNSLGILKFDRIRQEMWALSTQLLWRKTRLPCVKTSHFNFVCLPGKYLISQPDDDGDGIL